MAHRVLRMIQLDANPAPRASQGRSYALPGVGNAVDVQHEDGLALASDGGFAVRGLVGSTTARPAPSDADFDRLARVGGVLKYFDVSLSVWLRWDDSAGVWRNDYGAVVPG